jgi:hypothetical protein
MKICGHISKKGKKEPYGLLLFRFKASQQRDGLF